MLRGKRNESNFFAGSKKDQLAGLCQSLPCSPDHRSGSKKYLDLFTNYL